MMYRIGQLARLAHVTPDTVRYYEKRGLMGHDTRTEGGFRLYNPAELQRLRFIRHARQVGFTLDAIAELLSIRIDPQHHTCEESKKIVERRLQDVDDMIAELQTMQRSLRRLSDACCGGMHDSRHCSILEILEQGSDVLLTHRRT